MTSRFDLSLATILNDITASPTMAMTQAARDLKRAGRDVISLSAGEPDFETPEHIRAAGISAINAGYTRYTPVDGLPALKSAISRRFMADHGLAYKENEITIAPGGKAIIYNAFRATLNPGDEVIIPTPYWVSYPDIVRLCGGRPVIPQTNADARFLLSAEKLDAAITPATKWLVLNSPCNPTGEMYTEDNLRALATVLQQHPNVMVLTDDIYEKITFDGRISKTIAGVAGEMKERTLTMNGVSKAYAMTGWRIGYAGGPAPLVKAMAKIMMQSTSNPCTISQYATIAALDGDHSFLTGWNKIYSKRRDFVVQSLNASPLLRCATPSGAFYVFFDCRGALGKTSLSGTYLASDIEFATSLLNEALVAIVPGSAFGAPGFCRLSYAASDELLSQACERILAFCDSLSG